MFKRLRRIRGYGVFDDYSGDAVGVPEFAKRNLIYGWNYSGKTTLSRVFRSFETGSLHPDFIDGSFSLELQDGSVLTEGDAARLPVPVRVFNSDFVRENLSWEEAGNAEPILVLGEESISLQEELAARERQLKRRATYAELLVERQKAEQNALEAGGTLAARAVRENCGTTPFNRRPHLQEVVDGLSGDPLEYLLSPEAYQAQLARLAADKRDVVGELELVASFRALADEIESALGSSAEQKTIARLKADATVAAWVQDGLPLHEEGGSCQFCERPLQDGWLKVLAGHYSTEFRNLQNQVDNLRARLTDWTTPLDLPQRASLYSELQDRLTGATERYRDALDALHSAITVVLGCLEKKAEDVTQIVDPPPELRDLTADRVNSAIEAINSIIREHNDRVANFESVQSDARAMLIKHHAAHYLEDVRVREREALIDELEDRQAKNTRRVRELEERVGHLRSQLVEEERGAVEVNRYLRTFFGAKAIQVEWEDGGKYRLVRSAGDRATNLSEGEKTGVAFSYFLAGLADHRIGEESPIVYIDDPISSLDANHLYNTFAAIKATLKESPQVFVSTHDYSFFRLLARDSFFQEDVKGKRRGSWFLVRRGTSDRSELVDLPTSLRRFHSEYHYLFHLCHQFHLRPDENDELAGMIPNLLRRMLEIFTNFKMPSKGSDLLSRLENLSDDSQAIHRIYKFTNHGSHSDVIDLVAEPPQLEECKEVVIEVMGLIASIDRPHFDAMVDLAAA